ncbi:hypothetical protein TNCV_3553631 [Trichonephila clavipes]|nr:hypothetical protein TNCV_3553631 [Trichonephila clavipes]
MLNDDEIVTSVQEESNPVNDEADEDEDNNNNNESSKGPSSADACSALETARNVRFHMMHGSHSVCGYMNNHVSERCRVPIDSDK